MGRRFIVRSVKSRNVWESSRYTRMMRAVPKSQPAVWLEGAILAVDYGRARIGLAIASVDARIARPLATLERVNRNQDMRRLRELVREYSVKQIVVGLPL